MPVLRSIRERFRRGAAARRREGRRLPPRDRGDGEPDAGADRRRRRGGALLGQPAHHPGRGGGGAGGPRRAGAGVAAARTSSPTRGTCTRWPTGGRTSRSTTAPTCSMLIHERGQEVCGRRRGDHHRPAAPAAARGGGQAGLPGRGGERVAHRAHLQRPLRHRPVGARRDPARHQPAARRPHAGAARLRRHRQGHRPAGARRRRHRDRLRGRPAAGARGAHGRASR